MIRKVPNYTNPNTAIIQYWYCNFWKTNIDIDIGNIKLIYYILLQYIAQQYIYFYPWSEHGMGNQNKDSDSPRPLSPVLLSFVLTNKILWIRFINNAFNILSDNSYIITDFCHGNILPEVWIGTCEGNISLTSHRIRYSDSMILTINESWVNRWLIQ